MNDTITAVAPNYPDSERARRHTGSGLLRLTLDLKTGSVIRVAVVKSTGFSALDYSAIDAFRRWRWKPGRWKEIDMTITFVLTRRPPAIITKHFYSDRGAHFSANS
jgi:TonB family protein